MRAVIVLGLLMVSSVAAADPKFGFYNLSHKKRASSYRDDGTQPPSCGDAGRQRLAGVPRLEIHYDGAVIVNSQRWADVNVAADTVTATHTDANGDWRLVISFRREGRTSARAALSVLGIAGATVTCADAVMFSGSFAK